MPMGANPATLAPPIEQLRREMAAAGKPTPEIIVLTSLALEERDRAAEQIHRLGEIGATRIVHGWRYSDVADFARAADQLRSLVPMDSSADSER